MAVAGIVLLVIGLLVAFSEAHNPTHGVAGTIGIGLATAGVALALIGAGAAVAIGVGAGVLLAAGGAGTLVAMLKRVQRTEYRRVATGAEGLIGQIGIVRSWTEEAGSISLQGAVWSARRSPVTEDDEAEPELHCGDRVVVERLSGLTLSVRPAEEWELL
jgi:membrane-bound ClpP family serine protease